MYAIIIITAFATSHFRIITTVSNIVLNNAICNFYTLVSRICVICKVNFFSAEKLSNVMIGVKDTAPNPLTTSDPTSSDFKECDRIAGPVGSAETALVACSPEGVSGRYLVLMIDSSSSDNVLTVCEITAGGSKQII